MRTILLLSLLLILVAGCAPETTTEQPATYTSIIIEHPEPAQKCTDLPPAKALEQANTLI